MPHLIQHNISFRDPYFSFRYSQRLAIKIASAAFYGFWGALTMVLLASGKERLMWPGILFLVMLIDRLLQLKSGEKKIDGRLIRKVEEGLPVNAAPYFRQDTRAYLERGLTRSELEWQNLALAVLEELSELPEVRKGLQRLNIDHKSFLDAISRKFKESPPGMQPDYLISDPYGLIPQIGQAAFQESMHLGETAVSPAALFLGLLQLRVNILSDIFKEFGFNEEDFHNAIIYGRLSGKLGKRYGSGAFGAVGRKRVPHRFMNRAWTARWTPFLDSVARDLTDLARANLIGLLVGHEAEYRSLVNILSRETKNNALLVGPAGVGKDAIVEHLAFRITRDEVPAKLFDKRLLAVDIPAVTAGAKTAGEIQEKFARLTKEILDAGNIVLYFPDIHNLKLATEGGAINAFEYLQPLFEASAIPTIGSTTPQEYRTIIEPASDFAEIFDVIRVSELSEEEAAEFLTYQSFVLEAKWKITISYKAIRRAVKLAKRYLRQKPLPGSAIDLLGEALADVKNQKRDALTEEDVIQIFISKTKIPVEVATEKEAEKLLRLEEKLHERLINQDEAVKAVASAIRQYRAGLTREKGTIATFLFIGPTGVGKTELSKALAEIYFGSEDEMIRFDMSEYQDKQAIWNFIGSPDGSIRGNLTEAVKMKPFSLILLDEFEKAHPDILELFLPLFDEGRLSDSLGNVIDFTNTIIICTSNAHSDYIKTEIEKGTSVTAIADTVKKRLTEYFKPELINRFDDIIVFRPLTEEEIERIAELLLKKLTKRLEEEQGIFIEFKPEVLKIMARLGWNPVFGARPLRGVIREKINDLLANQILKGEIGRGDKIILKVVNEEIAVEKKQE